MMLKFDLKSIKHARFGVGRFDKQGDEFAVISVDSSIQKALHEMVRETFRAMRRNSEQPKLYSPSEKHAPTEYLYLPISNRLCKRFSVLHSAVNLRPNADAFNDLIKNNISCYFTKLIDARGNHLTAMRRPIQFKGNLGKRLVEFTGDSLKIVKRDIFRLDNDFDVMIDDENVHILKPISFEHLGDLQQAILKNVPKNIRKIQNKLPFIDFDSIEEYAKDHILSAKYLASIRSQNLSGITSKNLRSLCQKTDVKVSTVNGQLKIDKENVTGFLQVLDRRRYEVELISNKPEKFTAASRQKIT